MPRAERVVAGAKGAHVKLMEMPAGKGTGDGEQLGVELRSQLFVRCLSDEDHGVMRQDS